MIWIGTSGWQYRDWRGTFYPEGLPTAAWLRYYAHAFPTVEVNNSFYRLPSDAAFRAWRDATRPGFVMAVKASRYITHVRRMRDPREPVALLWSRARHLGDRLGPVLFQMPPTLRRDRALLADLLAVLPSGMRAAFEFRHDSWRDEDVLDALDRAGAAWVLAHRPGLRVPPIVTGGWSYVRFHQGTRTGPGYRSRTLSDWAGRIAASDARDTFVYFNNDTGGAAVADARRLAKALRRRGVTPAEPT
ncbi:MAG TPA: DUF72 domain-containing protein [Actinomycetota bacterium]